MKKIFLLIMFLISVNLSANAYYQVNYNAAGGVTSTVNTVPTPFGAQTYVNHYTNGLNEGYGSNALFSPNTIRSISERQRQIRNEKKYLENTKNINVNINHTGINPYRYNNGYYNYPTYTHYPTYGGIRYNNRGFNGINTNYYLLKL